MSALISLISPLLSNGYFWGGTIAALGLLAAWIYLNGRSSGKAAERQKALKQEIKEREKYENGNLVLLCLVISGLTGCVASSQRSSAAVCFPPWDFSDKSLMELNASNWGKVVGTACLCDPENKACKD